MIIGNSKSFHLGAQGTFKPNISYSHESSRPIMIMNFTLSLDYNASLMMIIYITPQGLPGRHRLLSLGRDRETNTNMVYARRMGQPTQRATNYTARSNIVTAQIFFYANGQRPNRAMIRQRSRRRQRRGEPHTEHGLGVLKFVRENLNTNLVD